MSKDVNLDDVYKILYDDSGANIEAVINEAVIISAYDDRKQVNMNDIIRAVFVTQYEDEEDYDFDDIEQAKEIAIHEAGHIVISEVLCPNSVGIASINPTNIRRGLGGLLRDVKLLKTARSVF